jgi:glycosyltransferase involved in cell wall biosynthesis
MADTAAVSVLLPTRGRTTALKTSLESLVNLARRPRHLEILLAFDDDDDASLEFFTREIASVIDQAGAAYTTWQFPRLGYIRLNEYVNYLAGQAQGQWLMFWGDDAIMETRHWDQRILEVSDFRVLRIPTHNQHPYAIFPIVPRAWFELFGYVSAHQLSDTWVSQIAYIMDIMQDIDVQVTHDRFDITGNNCDDTWRNRPMLEGDPQSPRDFNHVTWRDRRWTDCRRLAEYLRDQGQDTAWFDAVLRGEQDPWAKMCSAERDPNGQVRRLPQ